VQSLLCTAVLITMSLVVSIGMIVQNGKIRHVQAALTERHERVFVHGIFTLPRLHEQRNVHRATWMTSPLVCTAINETETCAIIVYFVIGLVPNSSRVLIERENATRGDLIELDVEENMNSGKTFDWFRFAAHRFPTARFISKGDMDTFVYSEDLLRSVRHLPRPARSIYGGNVVDWKSCGGYDHCPYGWVYMAGGFYFISQDLVQWFGAVNNTFVNDNSMGHEDLQVGKCLHFSGIRVLYMTWGTSKRAWAHPIKNISSFYEL